MKHDYEKRKQKRIDYAKEQSEKNQQESEQHFKRASNIGSYIPMGQPILVGHHSEKKHRRALKQIDDSMRKSVDTANKAAYYDSRVKAMEQNTAISSDDPKATEKLQERLATLVSLQQFMKQANRCIKKQDKNKFLQLEYGTEKLWLQLNTPDFANRIGYPGYSLTNNNANIHRIRGRINSLQCEAGRTASDITIKGVRLVENTHVNRVQLLFPHKPADEIRSELKKCGFRWCREEQAWQRLLNSNGVYAATQFLATYQQPAIPLNTAGANNQADAAA